MEIDKALDKLEQASFIDDDDSEVPPSDIVAFNDIKSCSDLKRMHASENLQLNPDFQRDFVWNHSQQTRFIDSLIKRLPIPSMCLAFDFRTEKWIVIDGRQRISTIIRFLDEDKNWTLSKLDDVDPKISGQHTKDFHTNSTLRKYYNRVEDLSIPVTVLRCDMSKESHTEYLFTIFHRLNTYGVKITNQEIRNCIFGGPFNQLLFELDSYPNWRKLNAMKPGENYRFSKQEIILRAFAFSENLGEYNGQLAKFLNKYMKANRKLNFDPIEDKKSRFQRSIDLIFNNIFDKKSWKLSVSVQEALLVGVIKNLESLEEKSSEELKNKFKELQEIKAFSSDRLKEGLSSKARVNERMSAANLIFS